MKSFFEDIFRYHHHFNQQLIDQLEEVKNHLPEKPLYLLSHLINAHQIWNARILGSRVLGVHEIHSPEQCRKIDRENLTDTLRILNEVDLEKVILYQNSQGKKFSNSTKEILFHIANHSTHHKGQIIAAIRNQGIDPVVTDYIFYKR